MIIIRLVEYEFDYAYASSFEVWRRISEEWEVLKLPITLKNKFCKPYSRGVCHRSKVGGRLHNIWLDLALYLGFVSLWNLFSYDLIYLYWLTSIFILFCKSLSIFFNFLRYGHKLVYINYIPYLVCFLINSSIVGIEFYKLRSEYYLDFLEISVLKNLYYFMFTHPNLS